MTPNSPHFDILGREIFRQSGSFDGRNVAIKTDYDRFGRVSQVSRPYFENEGPRSWSSFYYDALGRVFQEVAPDGGVTSYGYDGQITWVTRSPDNQIANDQTTMKLTNSQGKVEKISDATGRETKYLYDAFGNLTTTIDPHYNAVIMSYDDRGRKITMSDPDMGNWQYRYNVLGELVGQTDGKAQISSMTYDELGRIKTKVEPDLTSQWTYDTCAYGKGKLCSSSSSNGHSRSYTYDNLGRVSQEVVTIDQVPYTTSSTYDNHSRVFRVTYPTGFSVVNVYNSLGYLAEVRRGDNNFLVWRAETFEADGQLARDTLGNGVETRRTHYPYSGRPKEILVGGNGSLGNILYTHDLLGNVKSRFARYDGVPEAVSEFYGYDKLNRLTSVTSSVPGGAADKTLQYNEIGNIIFKTGMGVYSYNANQPHAVRQAGGNSYLYDANGNLYNGAGRSLTYTSFNLPETITQGGTTLSFAYDADHNRFKEVGPAGTRIYLNPRIDAGLHYEKLTGPNGAVEHSFYIYAGKTPVARYVQIGVFNSISYLHHDVQGSLFAVSDESGQIVQRFSYDAFGKRRNPNGTDTDLVPIAGFHHGYTGHEHLDKVGLIHMNARVYDPALGRFMSADPLIQEPFNLQSLNRYSYVLNNSMFYTDPSGYSWWTKWRKPIIAIAVSVFTYGAASGWVMGTYGITAGGVATSGYASMSAWAAATSSGYFGLSVGTLAGAAGGAAAGFAAGGIMGGNLQSAVYGAMSGGISGGISGTFGDTYNWKRVAADGVAGGIDARMRGGKFAEGFKFNATVSLLTYGAVKMRQAMVSYASQFPGQLRDSVGARGAYGIGIAGELTVRDHWEVIAQPILEAGGTFEEARAAYRSRVRPGLLGGYQGGPGMLGSITYGRGHFLDYVLEAYAGPHDWINSNFFYCGGGMSCSWGSARWAGELLSGANVIPATFLAAASAVPDHARWMLSPAGR